MGEEITYADLWFHASSHGSASQSVEKNPEDTSSEHSRNHCRCLKKTYIILGILVSALLLLLLTMTILLLQATGKQNYYRGRIQNISQTLANVKSDLCITNDGEQRDSCLLCPMNWVLIKNQCYYMPDKMLTWQESQRFCFAHNSSLAMPKTYEERELIVCNFRRWSPLSLWIGLSCSSKTNGRWLWMDNTPYNAYSSQCRDITCASFDYSILLYTVCSAKLKFICQRSPITLPKIN